MTTMKMIGRPSVILRLRQANYARRLHEYQVAGQRSRPGGCRKTTPLSRTSQRPPIGRLVLSAHRGEAPGLGDYAAP